MPAQQLYEGDVQLMGPSYFQTPSAQTYAEPRAAMTLSMMQMQRRMRQEASHAAQFQQQQQVPQWRPAGVAPRRDSMSSDPSLSPLAVPMNQNGMNGDMSGRTSPGADPRVLPTLSSMLHNSWSPPRLQPGEPSGLLQLHQSNQSAMLHPLPPTHRPSRCLSIATSPIFSRSVKKTDSSWKAESEIKSEGMYSPMNVGTPRSDMEDYPMAPSPRESCSSPSNYSTTSATDENQGDDDVKTNASETTDRKTSRYLREMDRRAILERLARGEKQATLAKEYHVSRAAICNLYKHRHEVMARTDEDPFAKHPKKRKNKKTLKSRRSRSLRLATASSAQGSGNRAVVTPPVAPSHVSQVQSDAVLLLLTIMSDRRSGVDEFRRASERVLWLLIEEALSTVPIKLTQVAISAQSKIMGVATEHPACAISMEQHSSPMLEVFQLLEPDRPFGHIQMDSSNVPTLSDTHLPPTLKYHNVFLFDIAVISSETVRSMIECAKERGALEVMIYIVALFISSDVVETLQQSYPHVRIVTTQIESHILESQKNRRSCVDVVLGRFDQVYQTQYTLI